MFGGFSILLKGGGAASAGRASVSGVKGSSSTAVSSKGGAMSVATSTKVSSAVTGASTKANEAITAKMNGVTPLFIPHSPSVDTVNSTPGIPSEVFPFEIIILGLVIGMIVLFYFLMRD